MEPLTFIKQKLFWAVSLFWPSASWFYPSSLSKKGKSLRSLHNLEILFTSFPGLLPFPHNPLNAQIAPWSLDFKIISCVLTYCSVTYSLYNIKLWSFCKGCSKLAENLLRPHTSITFLQQFLLLINFCCQNSLFFFQFIYLEKYKEQIKIWIF